MSLFQSGCPPIELSVGNVDATAFYLLYLKHLDQPPTSYSGI